MLPWLLDARPGCLLPVVDSQTTKRSNDYERQLHVRTENPRPMLTEDTTFAGVKSWFL